MAINLSCYNYKCRFYYESMCMKNTNEEPMHIDENGSCQTFEVGVSEWYGLSEVEGDGKVE